MSCSPCVWAAARTLMMATALGLSCAPTPQSITDTRAADEAAIREADIAWSRAAQARDLETLASYYADDAIVLLPNRPAVVGKEAAIELNRSMLAVQLSVEWQPERVEAARSGDLGYARGNYVLTVRGPDGVPVTDRGKYVEVWRKQPGGSWKVAVEAFNSDLPAGATAPSSAPN